MKDHAECLRMVKENYRKVTQGSSSGGGNSSSTLSSRRNTAPEVETRGASSFSATTVNEAASGISSRKGARAAAGAAAGAAGIVVGAAAGVAVGAAAGVVVGAAFLAGHRKGSHEEHMARSSSPSRHRRRGGSEGPGGERADEELRSNSGGWIPIDAPEGVQRRPSGGNGGGGSRPTLAGTTSSSRQASSSGRGSRGAGTSSGAPKTERGAGGGPTWLGRG